jgi:microcystin-dependent protein
MKILRTILFSPVGVALIFLLGCAVWANAQVYLWSQTANNNQSVGSVRFNIGGPPSMTEDSFRQVMADIAAWRDDLGAVPSSTETTGTYALTTNQHFNSILAMDHRGICFTAASTNAGSDSLAVDSLPAKPIVANNGVAVHAGVIVSGTPYCVTYVNSAGEFYLMDFYGDTGALPIGGMVDYTATTAPNSNFAVANGQCISQTTYAALFAMIGSTYGSCSAGLFAVPDMRSRVTAGLTNMGGGDTGLLAAYCADTTLGATCGAQSQFITQAQLPNYGISASFGFSGNQQTIGIDQGAIVPNAQTAFQAAIGGLSMVSQNSITATFTETPSGSITGGVTLGGGGSPLTTIQPTMFLYKLIRIQ